MLGRNIVVIASVVAAMPAWAGELKPEEAKRFIAGKYFSYTCFDGTSGAGQVHAVALPTGTIRVQPDSICASLRGMPFQPCFTIQQTDAKSFRGAISGLNFAYCDFTRRNPRLEVAVPPHPATDLGMLRTSISE